MDDDLVAGQHRLLNGADRFRQASLGEAFRRQVQILQQQGQISLKAVKPALPEVRGNLAQRVQIRPGGAEGAVRHPEIADPEPAVEGRHHFGILKDFKDLLDNLLVSKGTHGGEHGDQDRVAQKHGETAGKRADMLLFVELRHLLIQFGLILGILLLKRLHFRGYL